MFERLKKHSKNENTVFKGDFYLDDTLAIDFTKLNILHEKLNTNSVNILPVKIRFFFTLY